MIFELRESALLRLALGPVRFDPWEFFDEAAYPAHRAEKDEVEAFVREYVVGLDRPGLEAAVRQHAEYLRKWVPDRAKAAETDADYARLCAFAELHHAIADAEHELTLASLLPPARGDLVFREHPALYDTLTDGLMRLTPAHIEILSRTSRPAPITINPSRPASNARWRPSSSSTVRSGRTRSGTRARSIRAFSRAEISPR
jgi:hypothetical protein